MPRRQLALEVSFVTGAYEAQDPRGEPEWPPHPYRLFAAMIAVAGPAQAEQETAAIEALARARPPKVWAAPLPDGACSDPAWSVYVPSMAQKSTGSKFARQAERAVRPPIPVVRFEWDFEPDAKVTDDQMATLAELAERITYLGRAGSFVVVRVVDPTEETVPDGLICWEPYPGLGAEVQLRIPALAMLEKLNTAYEAGLYATERHGAPSAGYRRSRAGRSLADVLATPGPWTRLVTWRLTRGHLPQEFLLPACEGLRAAVLSVMGDDCPPSITGHMPNGEPCAPHAAFLGLVDVGHAHATGQVMGVGIALPEGAPTPPMPTCLQLRGRYRFALAEVETSRRPPWGLQPGRWSRPSTLWASATPVALPWRGERRNSAHATARAVRAACRIAGFPEPVEVDVDNTPFLRGPLPAHHYVRARSRKGTAPERRRACHAVVRFPEPVAGPVVLGTWRHFGLGLFVPFREEHA